MGTMLEPWAVSVPVPLEIFSTVASNDPRKRCRAETLGYEVLWDIYIMNMYIRYRTVDMKP